MALPTLTSEQRANALARATEVRAERAEVKDQLKRGIKTIPDVLAAAASDDVIGKLKVASLLEAMPGVGKVRRVQIMERLQIADSRRLRGLGKNQRQALEREFAGA